MLNYVVKLNSGKVDRSFIVGSKILDLTMIVYMHDIVRWLTSFFYTGPNNSTSIV